MSNTAVAQAFYNKRRRQETLHRDRCGQWGSALAMQAHFSTWISNFHGEDQLPAEAPLAQFDKPARQCCQPY
jgi:hypothetical protein